ncbi:MAG: glycosyltransferase family 4 protein [bacterium]
MPSPNLIIDGRRLVKHSTGVGRYLGLLLNAWAAAPENLPFAPLVKLHRPDRSNAEPWQAVFPSEATGSWLPGLAWENLCLASGRHRHLLLFAPANLVPARWSGPVVLVIHDTFAEYPDSGLTTLQNLRFRRRYRHAARRADLILTPSQSTADDVQRFFQISPNRIRVIRPGLPPDFKPCTPLQSQPTSLLIDEPFVLFVGKKSRRRAFDHLLQAVAHLRQKGMRIRLVAVGPSLSRQITSDCLTDLGHVSDTTLIQLYRQARALVCPSSREGFGLPVAEAMACGCPVVILAQGALAEVAGNACLALAGQQVADIASAISKLCENNSLRENLVEAGLVRARLFQVNRFADEVASALAEFVG